jgi:hypothetical protein
MSRGARATAPRFGSRLRLKGGSECTASALPGVFVVRSPPSCEVEAKAERGLRGALSADREGPRVLDVSTHPCAPCFPRSQHRQMKVRTLTEADAQRSQRGAIRAATRPTTLARGTTACSSHRHCDSRRHRRRARAGYHGNLSSHGPRAVKANPTEGRCSRAHLPGHFALLALT